MSLQPRTIEPNFISRWSKGALVLWRRNWLPMWLLGLLSAAPPLMYLSMPYQTPVLVDFITLLWGMFMFCAMGVCAVRAKFVNCGASDIYACLSLTLDLYKQNLPAMISPRVVGFILGLTILISSPIYIAAAMGNEKVLDLWFKSAPVPSDVASLLNLFLSAIVFAPLSPHLLKCASIFRVFFSSYGVDMEKMQDMLMVEAWHKNRQQFFNLVMCALVFTTVYQLIKAINPLIGFLAFPVLISFLANFCKVAFMDMMSDDTELKIKEFKLATNTM